MGIRSKTLFIMGIMGLIALLSIGAASYQFSMGMAAENAKTNGKLILNYIHATRKYLKNKQRPLVKELVEEDRFYPELMSGFAVARGTHEIFSQQFPEYIFKQATLDPLLPENKADFSESEIIYRFGAKPEMKRLGGSVKRKGIPYYYYAEPIKVSDRACLTCHGDPKDAPKDQIEIYGEKNGYFWKLGSTVAAFIVYVPLKEAQEKALQSTLTLLTIGGGCLFLSLFGSWFFVNRSIVKPILRISKRAEEISLGKHLSKEIQSYRNDEIGTLNNSVERLRNSMVRLLKWRIREKRK